ncbi:hypothetical protein FQR65_LT19817 [Abscondita terminalis]|nr:hypothetical protein FQR65_LT19817 [Abscondita terminalis]
MESRKIDDKRNIRKLFVNSRLGGMSGATAKSRKYCGGHIDQTSLHNPWAGGYYPAGISFDESNRMMTENPELFKAKVQETLCRHAEAVNRHAAKGTYFFDYGNAFPFEASRAGADVMAEKPELTSDTLLNVQDIMGLCVSTLRIWVRFAGYVHPEKPEDLIKTDDIACKVLEENYATFHQEKCQQQMQDNIIMDKRSSGK